MSTYEPAWRFPEKDGFSRIAPEHRMTVVHSLPGMIVWPILLFVLFIAFSMVVASTWQMFSLDPDPQLLTTVIFAASAAAYATLALAMWVRFSSYGAARSAFSILPVNFSEIGLAILVLLFVITIGGRLSVMFHEFAMVDASLTLSGGAAPEDLTNVDEVTQSGAALWAVILLSVIAAPIVEEILFRGWMLPMLMARGVPTIFAILISSVAFGLIHTPQGLLVMTTTTFLGIGLGIARVVTGRVAAPVLGHMANNAWAVFVVPQLLGLQSG